MTTLLGARDVALDWRPQDFGHRPGRGIEDPIVEPLWDGPRVLVAIEDGVATPFHEGEPFEGPADVLRELVAAVEADGLVLEGSLTGQALGSGEGASIDAQDKPPGAMTRLFGTVLGSRRREIEGLRAKEAEQARQAREVVAGRSGPVAFVATDLLWLDGQSLLDVPLLERKRLLDSVLGESELVRRSAYVRPSAKGSLMGWKALGFHTLAYKAANSRYHPGKRNDGWASVPIAAVTRAPR